MPLNPGAECFPGPPAKGLVVGKSKIITICDERMGDSGVLVLASLVRNIFPGEREKNKKGSVQ